MVGSLILLSVPLFETILFWFTGRRVGEFL